MLSILNWPQIPAISIRPTNSVFLVQILVGYVQASIITPPDVIEMVTLYKNDVMLRPVRVDENTVIHYQWPFY